MTNIFKIIVFSLCILPINIFASELELKQSTEGPSYEETVNYLESKNLNSSRSALTISNCILKNIYWEKIQVLDMKRASSAYTEPLSVNPNCIAVYIDDPKLPGGRLEFNHNCINGTSAKFAKALNHLRKLCGAKDDPF
jgi:superfamily I DNA and/or RNA helicase